ncbi:MAG: SAM-dependent methyltransferase [Sphingobacteriia bacterium]|nr:SAM-dependent methyltransferase [Sphingobacteriia bacterium]
MESEQIKGKLILLPTPIRNIEDQDYFWYPAEVVSDIRIFAIEEIKTARRWLRKVDPRFPIDSSEFHLLNEHTKENELSIVKSHLDKGATVGLMSEAGLPCVADPGWPLVRYAHEKKHIIIPHVGPSSLMMALMSSGQNGQNFTFHGYLPVDGVARANRLKELDKNAWSSGYSQIFIETPYRNQQMASAIVSSCKPTTLVTIALSIDTKEQIIRTMMAKDLEKERISLGKSPAVFIIGRP